MARIDNTLMGPSELAAYAGVKKNTVYMWRKRRSTNGMPDPDQHVGRTPAWKPDTIMPWLRITGRLNRVAR